MDHLIQSEAVQLKKNNIELNEYGFTFSDKFYACGQVELASKKLQILNFKFSKGWLSVYTDSSRGFMASQRNLVNSKSVSIESERAHQTMVTF